MKTVKRVVPLFLVIVLSMIFIACGGNNNPLDYIKYNKGKSDLIEHFGEPDDTMKGLVNPNVVTYTFKEIDFFGYKGELRVRYVTEYGIDWFEAANWTYTKTNETTARYDKTVDSFINKLTKLYGPSTKEKGSYIWYDNTSHEFQLWPGTGTFTVHME